MLLFKAIEGPFLQQEVPAGAIYADRYRLSRLATSAARSRHAQIAGAGDYFRVMASCAQDHSDSRITDRHPNATCGPAFEIFYLVNYTTAQLQISRPRPIDSVFLQSAGRKAYRPNLSAVGQRRPRRQRIHVVAPAHDLAVLNKSDRDKSVIVGNAGLEYEPHIPRSRLDHSRKDARPAHPRAQAVCCCHTRNRAT
jgi:hypothetical protein